MPFTLGGDYLPSQPSEPSKKSNKKIKIKVERRNQKYVTIIENLDLADHELKEKLSTWKKKFSCGGTIKNNKIELQGNFEDQIKI